MDAIVELERLVAGDERASSALDRARLELSTALAAGAGAGERGTAVRASLLAHLAAQRGLEPELARRIAAADPAVRAGEVLRAIGHPRISALPLVAAVDAHRALLEAFAHVEALALFREDAAGRMSTALTHGAALAPGTARGLAERARATGLIQTDGTLSAVAVHAFGAPAAALVWAGGDDAARPLAQAVAEALIAPLQQAFTADVNVDAHQAIVQGPERRLTRLALDIHDGALQDVALIAGEIRRLEDELRPVVAGTPNADPVRGALENLAALVDALDGDLRDVATNVEGPTMLRRPFADVIDSIVRVFRARVPLPVDLEIDGELDLITQSQRIALFRIVQESLNNIRRHSSGTRVSIDIRADSAGVVARIADDGVGFDASATLDRASREGRTGLLGMIERVRLLGGRCDIVSSPGAGTEVRVAVARYEPVPPVADRRSGNRG